jgi:hypothetical protein
MFYFIIRIHLTQKIGYIVAAFHPVIDLLWPYTLGLIGFQTLFVVDSAKLKI